MSLRAGEQPYQVALEAYADGPTLELLLQTLPPSTASIRSGDNQGWQITPSVTDAGAHAPGANQ